jgi:L-rhamnose mutarotase
VLLEDDPEIIHRYEQYHANVWPQVVEGGRRCGLLRTYIYRFGCQLFMFMETRDDFDLERDLPKYMEDPKAREWDELMRTFPRPVPGAPADDTWVQMKEVFSHENVLERERSPQAGSRRNLEVPHALSAPRVKPSRKGRVAYTNRISRGMLLMA